MIAAAWSWLSAVMNPLTVSPLGLRALYLNLKAFSSALKRSPCGLPQGDTLHHGNPAVLPGGVGTRGFASPPLDGFAFNFTQQHLN
jgi:hypothetical protein